MACPDVVSLVASTKKTSVPAYAIPIRKMRGRQIRRASGKSAVTLRAAIPLRKQAICQLVSEHALIAAPPVENRKAAANSNRR